MRLHRRFCGRRGRRCGPGGKAAAGDTILRPALGLAKFVAECAGGGGIEPLGGGWRGRDVNRPPFVLNVELAAALSRAAAARKAVVCAAEPSLAVRRGKWKFVWETGALDVRCGQPLNRSPKALRRRCRDGRRRRSRARSRARAASAASLSQARRRTGAGVAVAGAGAAVAGAVAARGSQGCRRGHGRGRGRCGRGRRCGRGGALRRRHVYVAALLTSSGQLVVSSFQHAAAQFHACGAQRVLASAAGALRPGLTVWPRRSRPEHCANRGHKTTGSKLAARKDTSKPNAPCSRLSTVLSATGPKRSPSRGPEIVSLRGRTGHKAAKSRNPVKSWSGVSPGALGSILDMGKRLYRTRGFIEKRLP